MNEEERKYIEKIAIEQYDKLMGYAMNYLNDVQYAEEAVQELFKRMCVHVRELMVHPVPQRWILTVLKNILRDTLTKQARDVRLLERVQEMALTSKKASYEDEVDLDVLYSNLEANEDFKLLKSLAEKQYKIKELAAEMGISLEACKKRVQRARKNLRKYFKEK